MIYIYIYTIVMLRLLYTRGINEDIRTIIRCFYTFGKKCKRESTIQSMSSYRSVNSNVKACGYNIVIEYKIH